MSRITEVKEIYDKITGIVTSSKNEWKDFLDFAARIYKYNVNVKKSPSVFLEEFLIN